MAYDPATQDLLVLRATVSTATFRVMTLGFGQGRLKVGWVRRSQTHLRLVEKRSYRTWPHKTRLIGDDNRLDAGARVEFG